MGRKVRMVVGGDGVGRGAVVSGCGGYRYLLRREWGGDSGVVGGDGGGGGVCFVGLNPSTADGVVDDATVRRMVGFARSWGYGWVEVVNLFGWRATKPEALWEVGDRVGRGNDGWVRWSVGRAERVVVAWGAWGSGDGWVRERVGRVMEVIEGEGREAWCLGVTKGIRGGGEPRHPLYVRGDVKLAKYVGRVKG